MISTFFIFCLMSFLLGICAFTILLILMQRPSEESGMGATLGGGAATSVFGGEAVNVLAKITKYCVIIFFTLSFILSMFYLALEKTIKPQNLLEKRDVVTDSVAAAETPTSDDEALPGYETQALDHSSQPAESVVFNGENAETLTSDDEALPGYESQTLDYSSQPAEPVVFNDEDATLETPEIVKTVETSNEISTRDNIVSNHTGIVTKTTEDHNRVLESLDNQFLSENDRAIIPQIQDDTTPNESPAIVL